MKGFPMVFYATNATDTDDTPSLAESIVRYAGRTSKAEAKVGALEERMRAMEMNIEMQQRKEVHTGFFTPLRQKTLDHIVIPGHGPIQGHFFGPYRRQEERTSACRRKKRRGAEDNPVIITRPSRPPHAPRHYPGPLDEH